MIPHSGPDARGTMDLDHHVLMKRGSNDRQMPCRRRSGHISNQRSEICDWLRFLETYRNLCISPSPEFLRTLAWMRDIQAILKPRQISNV